MAMLNGIDPRNMKQMMNIFSEITTGQEFTFP